MALVVIDCYAPVTGSPFLVECDASASMRSAQKLSTNKQQAGESGEPGDNAKEGGN